MEYCRRNPEPDILTLHTELGFQIHVYFTLSSCVSSSDILSSVGVSK